MKAIEEKEKWKCLLCDPTDIRAHRADYWAVHQYHKSKNAKAGATPSRNTPSKAVKNGSRGSSARKPAGGHGTPNRTPNGRPVPAIRPIATKNGKPLHHRGTPNNRLHAATNGGTPYKKHYVESMLLEADRAANKLKSMINDIRKSWMANTDRDDKTIVLATQKIRETFVKARSNLETADQKVIEIYRSNVDDADVRDIEPPLEDTEAR